MRLEAELKAVVKAKAEYVQRAEALLEHANLSPELRKTLENASFLQKEKIAMLAWVIAELPGLKALSVDDLVKSDLTSIAELEKRVGGYPQA